MTIKVLVDSNNVIVHRGATITEVSTGRFNVNDEVIYGENLELTLVESELAAEVLLPQEKLLIAGEVSANPNYVAPEE